MAIIRQALAPASRGVGALKSVAGAAALAGRHSPQASQSCYKSRPRPTALEASGIRLQYTADLDALITTDGPPERGASVPGDMITSGVACVSGPKFGVTAGYPTFAGLMSPLIVALRQWTGTEKRGRFVQNHYP